LDTNSTPSARFIHASKKYKGGIMNLVTVESDLAYFHHQIEPGDRILVVRSDGAIHGTYRGTTPGRFNLSEQCINLTDAVVLPSIFGPNNLNQILDFIEGTQVTREECTFDLGVRDFLIVKRG
jgi:hypothetical protein